MSKPSRHFDKMMRHVQGLEDELGQFMSDHREGDARYTVDLSHEFHQIRQSVERVRMLLRI